MLLWLWVPWLLVLVWGMRIAVAKELQRSRYETRRLKSDSGIVMVRVYAVLNAMQMVSMFCSTQDAESKARCRSRREVNKGKQKITWKPELDGGWVCCWRWV